MQQYRSQAPRHLKACKNFLSLVHSDSQCLDQLVRCTSCTNFYRIYPSKSKTYQNVESLNSDSLHWIQFKTNHITSKQTYNLQNFHNKIAASSFLQHNVSGVSNFSRQFSTSVLFLSPSNPEVTTTSIEGGAALQDVPDGTIGSDIASATAENVGASSGLLYPDFPLIQAAEKGIQYLHHLTGLPWWGCALVTAVLVRGVIMMPLTIYTHHNMLRLAQLQPEIKSRLDQLKEEVVVLSRRNKWDYKRASREFNEKKQVILKELYVRENCHPLKRTASFWFQLPIWVSVSFALRNMSTRALQPYLDGHTDCASLRTEGAAWFPDLTHVDSTWLLPVMMGAVTLFNVEWNYLQMPEVTRYRRFLTYFLRGVSIVFIPISASVPSIMVLYWVSSASLATSMNMLMETSAFRRLVGLPDMPALSQQTMGQRVRERYFFKLKHKS